MMGRMRPSHLVLAIAMAFSAPHAVAAADTGLKVREAGQWAPFLVDQDGRSLYVFSLNDGGAVIGACEEECLEKWPPLITDGQPELGAGVEEDLVSTVVRSDGRRQVTYDGWPLFYYFTDEGLDTEGQNLRDHGGPWYLIAPDGTIRNTPIEATPSPEDADGPS